jgi:hypothetical protein
MFCFILLNLPRPIHCAGADVIGRVKDSQSTAPALKAVQ